MEEGDWGGGGDWRGRGDWGGGKGRLTHSHNERVQTVPQVGEVANDAKAEQFEEELQAEGHGEHIVEDLQGFLQGWASREVHILKCLKGNHILLKCGTV